MTRDEWAIRARQIQDDLTLCDADLPDAKKRVDAENQIVAKLRVCRQRIEQERAAHNRQKPRDPNTVIEKPSYETVVHGEYPRYASERS